MFSANTRIIVALLALVLVAAGLRVIVGPWAGKGDDRGSLYAQAKFGASPIVAHAPWELLAARDNR